MDALGGLLHASLRISGVALSLQHLAAIDQKRTTTHGELFAFVDADADQKTTPM